MSPLHDIPIGLVPWSHLRGEGEPGPKKQVQVGAPSAQANKAAKGQVAEAARREAEASQQAPARQAAAQDAPLAPQPAPAGPPPFGGHTPYVAEVCARLGKAHLDGTEDIDWNRAVRELAARTEAMREKARQARQEEERADEEAMRSAAEAAAPVNAPAVAAPPAAGVTRESIPAPPREDEARAAFRWTCDKLALHLACSKAACRRARACRGDPKHCLNFAMDFYAPEPLLDAAIEIALAHEDGVTAEQAFAEQYEKIEHIWDAWTGALQAAADARG